MILKLRQTSLVPLSTCLYNKNNLVIVNLSFLNEIVDHLVQRSVYPFLQEDPKEEQTQTCRSITLKIHYLTSGRKISF